VRRFSPASIGSITRAVVVWATLAAAGCNLSESPGFRLNLEGPDREEVSLVETDAITETLGQLFGTPDNPMIPEGVGLDLGLLRMAAGPIGRFEDGRGWPDNQRGLYRQHCAVCHGISGDGAGPLASVFAPYPRDFRQGVFKYTSTYPSTLAGAKPTREDLERTLREGILTTGMPSFVELEPIEVASLIEYVKYLSIRGQTELFLIQSIVHEHVYLPLGADALEIVLEDGVQWAARSWALPGGNRKRYVVHPPEMPPVDAPNLLAVSIARGRDLYASERAQCVRCHGPKGAGDGEETELYDDWNKPKKGLTPKETKELARLFTLPIQRLRARDFRQGAFHGGSRPEDVYRRIHVGIKGTPMPAAGPMPGSAGALTPEEIWHVVNYIRSLAE